MILRVLLLICRLDSCALLLFALCRILIINNYKGLRILNFSIFSLINMIENALNSFVCGCTQLNSLKLNVI